MDTIFFIALGNFISLVLSLILLAYFYTLSILPVKRAAKYGEQEWKKCKVFRNVSGICEFISIINMILWIFYPLPIVGDWKICSNFLISIIIGFCIMIPCMVIFMAGMKAAGSETLTPSKDTKLYGGIYKYIRHPQALGEFTSYIGIGFLLNSWFLVIMLAAYLVIYTPIMIHYEEADLIRRFGEQYIEYKKKTGALFPKFRKSSE